MGAILRGGIKLANLARLTARVRTQHKNIGPMLPSASSFGCAVGAAAAAAVYYRYVLCRPRGRLPAPGATMRQLQLLQPAPRLADARFEVAQVPVPTPKHNELLVRVAAACVNPADYGACRLSNKPVPRPLGLECSGTIEATGGGLKAATFAMGSPIFCLPGSAWGLGSVRPASENTRNTRE